jgi:hypothetical protein
MIDRPPGEGANAVVAPIEAAANAAITPPLTMLQDIILDTLSPF